MESRYKVVWHKYRPHITWLNVFKLPSTTVALKLLPQLFQSNLCANAVLCLPPQGSLDNISIIIVCFPGAPQVSQEALQQEAELEQQIETKVEGAT